MSIEALEFDHIKGIENVFKGIDGEHPRQSNRHGSASITAFILSGVDQ